VTDRSATHATFTLERTYPADPARVFAAWADPAAKARWMVGSNGDHSLDFQVGGLEIVHSTFNDKVIRFTTTYVDIVEGERIAYNSTLTFDDELATASLTTVEFSADGDGTKLVLTEHGAYLDGHELPEWREEGTATQLDNLTKELS
jgi:uncharacterized protein YndB with AHSA1/START domain